MKANLVLGVVCAALASVAGARADSLSDLRREAYDEGWGSAHVYCEGLRYVPHGPAEFGTITAEFSRWCRKGFDNYINSNLACQERIRYSGSYREMWAARREACY